MKTLLIMLVVLLAGLTGCQSESSIVTVDGTVTTVSPIWSGNGDGSISIVTDNDKVTFWVAILGTNLTEPETRMNLRVESIDDTLRHRVRITGTIRGRYLIAHSIQQLPDEQ